MSAHPPTNNPPCSIHVCSHSQAAAEGGETAFLFPGQGAQYVGMAAKVRRDLLGSLG